MHPLEKLREDDIYKKFFESKGYQVSWDYDSNGCWYEISENNNQVAQLDFGVPMEDFLEDLTSFAKGAKQGTSKHNYLFWIKDSSNQVNFCNELLK